MKLTRDQEIALVEALANNGRVTDNGAVHLIAVSTFVCTVRRKLHLTQAGAILATLIRERDQAQKVLREVESTVTDDSTFCPSCGRESDMYEAEHYDRCKLKAALGDE